MERNELTMLVTAAQAGDQEALNRLFNEYYSKVYYFAYKTVKDENIAADITQDTFVQVIRNITSLRDPALFGSWIRTITYSRCSVYFKSNREIITDEDGEGNSIFDDIAENKTEFIPDEALDKEEFRNTVMAIVDSLPDEQRAAVLMYYFDELSVKQIAAIQGVSEGTVKSRLNYARKYIKASVEDYENRHGIKLHAAILPLMFWLFTSDSATIPMDISSVASNVAASTGIGIRVEAGMNIATATGRGIGNTVIKNIAQDAAKRSAKHLAAEGVKGVAGTVVKKAGLSLGAKIIAGLSAVAVTAGVATGTVALVNKSNELNEVQAVTTVKQSVSVNTESSIIDEFVEGDNSEEVLDLEVGDFITFGSYEQDADASNGAEPIEWKVLDKEDGKVLVMSKYVLDFKYYCNESNTPTTWETSDLRAWLNDEFYNTAFNEDEKSRIELSHLVNLDNPEFGIDGGNDTTDRVFILSCDEAEKYFASDEERISRTTAYADSVSVQIWGMTYENCPTFLRTPGESHEHAMCIYGYGGIGYSGNHAGPVTVPMNAPGCGHRPVMWITID